MKRSKRRSSMRADVTGVTWLWGWGHERKIAQRQARAARKRAAQREVRQSQDA